MADSAGTDGGQGGSSAIGEELDANIGLVGAVAIGVGTMIAAGIFVLSGLAVSNVGTVAIVSFLIAAVIASFTAAAYAEFSSIYQESGGGYMYVANTFEGTDLTYIMGWTMILGYPASAAFYLASFSDWFYRFMYPVFGIPQWIPYWIPGLAVLALLVYINISGSEESNQFQIVVTALKVALIILFLYGGLQAFQADVIVTSFTENITSFAQIGLTSALVFITFFGFSAIATNAEEIKNPGYTIPRAIYISMGFVSVIYALVVLVVVIAVNDGQFLSFLAGNVQLSGLAPAEYVAENGEVSMAYAAQYYLGPIGFYVIIVGALFSMLSAANATILAGSRVKMALARRDHLPRQFDDIHPEYNTPYKTILLTGGFILVFIMIFTVLFGENPLPSAEANLLFGIHLGLESVANFANFLLISGLSVVNVALIQARRQSPDLDRGFKVPFVPYLPIVAILANLALLANLGLQNIFIGLIAEALGVLFWFAWKSRATPIEEIERETPTAVTERNPSGHDRDYRIVVPIANPANTDQLMRTARDIAADRDGEIIVTSVVTVPDQTPLSRGRRDVDERREVISRAMTLARGDREEPGSGPTPAADGGEAEPTGTTAEERDRDPEADPGAGGMDDIDREVPVSGTVRIAHDVENAILNTITQYDADAVLMGWRGRPSRYRDAIVGSTVDTVATEADCDVLVERIESPGPVESILLPVAGGPHSGLAADTAGAVARSNDATVEAFRVLPEDANETDREDADRVIDEVVADLTDVTVERAVVRSDDVTEAIVERSGEHDLTVIGASREGLLEQLVFGTIPEKVGREAESTTIMAKRRLDVTSRLRRLLGRQ